MRKCQFDPEMARSPLVRPAISGLNWHFLPFRPSTGTYFGKSKKMEDKALSNTGKARDAGEEGRHGPDREGKEMRYIPLAAF